MVRQGEQLGAYVVRALLHTGDASKIYRVEHVALGASFAMKLAEPDLAEPVREATLRQAQLQARVQHANVVRCTDLFEVEGRPALILDYVDGPALSEILDAHQLLPRPQALAVFRGIVRGVRATHRAGIVHRDLKPENVLMQREGEGLFPRITDYDLAKDLPEGEVPRARNLSAQYRLFGTPEYMAPEQAQDPGLVDHRADLFSLGCMLYELVCGVMPFEAEDPLRALIMAADADYADPRQHQPDLAPALVRLVDALLKPNPYERVQSADELLEALAALPPG